VGDLKWEFVHSQVLASSVMASLQRANAYVEGVADDQRERFRAELTATLRDIGRRYSNTVSGSQHEQHILEVMDRASQGCRTALVDQHLRLGIAAKALNLYLKYLWCLGRIPMPPHCPFDRRVISLLPRAVQTPWTQMDDLSSYQALVRAAVECAHGEALAEWELRIYEGV
jgi:hypothetical protein